MTTSPDSRPALKDSIFSPARIQHIAAEARTVCATFDSRRFLAEALPAIDPLTLMERLRMVTQCLHAALTLDFRSAVDVLRQLAPRVDHPFAAMVLSDYVALYGADDFDLSLDALRFLTPFGSSEFAVRHFLRRDLDRTLAVMEIWSHDDDEHVRRLASEGSRPRLPWSFRIEPLMADPSPVAQILDNLKADPSLYVRKSVANHLNDITRDHPDWVIRHLRFWPLDAPHTAWIARHALRTMIKKGDPDALAIVGAVGGSDVILTDLAIDPPSICLGEEITLTFALRSTGDIAQRIVVDYAITYVRQGGRSSRKVFKLKTLTLEPGRTELFARRQSIRDFSTRKHHPGHHDVEVIANGRILGRTSFELRD